MSNLLGDIEIAMGIQVALNLCLLVVGIGIWISTGYLRQIAKDIKGMRHETKRR